MTSTGEEFISLKVLTCETLTLLITTEGFTAHAHE